PRIDPGFRPCGYVFLAHTEQTLARLAANVELQRRLGIPARIVRSAEASEIVPELATSSIAGASFCAEDGYFDRPQTVVEAFAEAAVRAGVSIEHDEVLSIESSAIGWSLVLRRAGRVRAGRLLVAAGTES